MRSSTSPCRREPLWRKKEITEKYGISRTPVREAILRLAEEHLVDVFPKSGTFVARIPVAELREAIVARKALEEVCVREATSRATKSQLMELRAIIQREQELADSGDEQAFHAADNAFHAGIASASGYPGIWQMIEKIRLQVERYRRLTLPQKGRMQLIVSEHTAVLDAMEKRRRGTGSREHEQPSQQTADRYRHLPGSLAGLFPL
ncbi:GntR family transcriptional regulator [Roseibium salinum]|nr:GntR family transcriptional regulator [Roseibium salinum]